MKRLAAVITTVTLIGTSAFAVPPAPAYNWTGWYAGVNAGAGFGNVKTDFNGAPFSIANPPTASVIFPIPGLGGSDTASPSGFIGGGQIGYNWQFSPTWVAGLEADFQGAVERGSGIVNSSFSDLNVPLTIAGAPAGSQIVTGTAVTDYTTQIDWFGTVRARLGYVWGNGEVLSYVTGGLAYGEVKINGTGTVSGLVQGALPFSVTNVFSRNAVNTGWVVGYGTEGHLPLMPGNWTWKIEGLYMDLGTIDTTGVITGASSGSTTPVPFFNSLTGGQVTTHTHFTDGILRGGLNYKFY